LTKHPAIRQRLFERSPKFFGSKKPPDVGLPKFERPGKIAEIRENEPRISTQLCVAIPFRSRDTHLGIGRRAINGLTKWMAPRIRSGMEDWRLQTIRACPEQVVHQLRGEDSPLSSWAS
jgi:hypothetical protein